MKTILGLLFIMFLFTGFNSFGQVTKCKSISYAYKTKDKNTEKLIQANQVLKTAKFPRISTWANLSLVQAELAKGCFLI